jgi:hypothetical protein
MRRHLQLCDLWIPLLTAALTQFSVKTERQSGVNGSIENQSLRYGCKDRLHTVKQNMFAPYWCNQAYE